MGRLGPRVVLLTATAVIRMVQGFFTLMDFDLHEHKLAHPAFQFSDQVMTTHLGVLGGVQVTGDLRPMVRAVGMDRTLTEGFL
ncbi:hypothetical protein D3C73_1363820 [compost metagenome]